MKKKQPSNVLKPGGELATTSVELHVNDDFPDPLNWLLGINL